MSGGFYRAFEERHRGSRKLIKGRLEAYLPFVEPLLQAYPAVAAVDLGCGRGEWVELLAGSGFMPMGIDLDAGMLDACLKLGLSVEQGDALAYLSALPDESQAVVSAFHVVEHIAFDQLRVLVGEALRALKPGGLLIMETPNPENIVVATRDFYLDPTHQRPIPPMLLAFVAEYAGFARVKTLRLQESKELVSRGDISLQDVFAGASPDYAVVAQKHASDDVLALISDHFGPDYGLSLEDLTGRWDIRFDRLESKAEAAESKAEAAESKAEAAESKAEAAESKAEAAESKAEQAESNVQEVLAQSEKVVSDLYQCQAQLGGVYASTSWRITKPVRFSLDQLRGLMQGRADDKAKQLAKIMLHHSIRLIIKDPRLKHVALALASRLGMTGKLQQLYSAQENPIPFQYTNANVSRDFKLLSPRARIIFADLKAAIQSHDEVGH